MTIVFEDVTFSYRGTPVLNNVSFSISQGEFIGIFGPNGGGKTTLLKLMMGFITPQKGKIRIFEKEPDEVRQRFGYVPQTLHTDPDFPITVKELIALGLMRKRSFIGGFSKEDWAASEYWMEELGLSEHKEKTYGELSGGLAQRALLARALVGDPDILLLDEPTANIDAHSLTVVLHTLEELRRKKTVLLITHDLNRTLQKADRLFSVQRTLSVIQPQEICNHFSFGLYQETR
jgi:zinc transport system ATP-binding protein